MKRFINTILVVSFLIGVSFNVDAATKYYVNDASLTGDVYCSAVGGAGGGNGLTPATPKSSLSSILTTYAASFVFGDTIFIDAGTYNDLDLKLSSPINGVVIKGAGQDLTTIDGKGPDKWFMNINDNNTVIRDIYLKNYANDGSAGTSSILSISANTTNVKIINVKIGVNTVSSSDYTIHIASGAGVLFQGGGSTCNTASGNSGGMRIVGAGTNVTIQDYLFYGNERDWMDGSALRIENGTVNVLNSRFEANISDNDYLGAAIYVAAGTVTVKDSYFNDNLYSHPGAMSASEVGGLILIAGGNFKITRSVLTNTAPNFVITAYGGAIGVNGGTVAIDSCSFTGNVGSKGNDVHVHGGTVTAFNSTFASAANQIGGTGGTFTLSNCGSPTSGAFSTGITFSNNTAPSYVASPSTPTFSGACPGVSISCSPPAAPTGVAAQSFCSSPIPTIASLSATGTNIQWYAANVGGVALATNTALVNGTTYYATQSTGSCESTSRLAVTVTITTAPSAGSNGSISLCSNGATVNLFNILGGTPDNTGVWTGASSLGGAHLGTFDPATMTDGVYTYTITGTGGCVGTNPSSTVTVTKTTLPSAGSDGTIALCSSGSSIDLFTILGGSPATTGAWTGPSVLGGAHLGTFNPGSNSGGVYTYTITGTDGCVGTNPTSTVTVTNTTAPNAGVNASKDFCTNGVASDLFTELGVLASSSGSWSGPSLLTGGNLGTFDPAINTVGVYTYTVTGTAGCLGTNPSSTVTVTFTSVPNAGANATLDLCSSSPLTDLFTSLGVLANTTGTWSGPTVLGGAHLGTFDPTTNTAGTYTYTVNGTGGCSTLNPSATVIVTLTVAPSSGVLSVLDNTLCVGENTTLSSTVLGGTWSSSSNLIATVDVNTGNVAAIGAGVATMTYTVAGALGCALFPATSTINITVTAAASVGTLTPVGSSLCLGGTTNMSSNVPGGTWLSSNPAMATIDANTGLVTAVSVGTVNMTYTVLGTGGCSGQDASGFISIDIVSSPTAGTLSALDNTLCSGTTTTVSSTSNGGTWTSSVPAFATVDANTGLVTALSAGTTVLTYTVVGTGSCVGANASQTINIDVTDAPTSGVVSSLSTDLCTPNTTTVSSTAVGGLWSSSSNLIATVDANTGLVTAVGTGTAIITYTVLGTAGCLGNDATSTININITKTPDAGVNGSKTYCSSGISSNLLVELGNTADATGSWTGPSVLAGAHLGTFNPSTNIAGVYTYTVTGTGACVGLNPTSTVTVTITTAASSGNNGNITLCSTGVSVDLINSLGGTPDATGTWSASPSTLGGGHLGSYDPATMTPGIYTYTVNGLAGCVGINASSTVTVVEDIAPNSGTNDVLTICSTGSATNLFTLLGGTPDASGTWSGPSVLAGNHLGIFNPNSSNAGVYTYTVAGNGVCVVSASSIITVTITSAPNSGNSGNVTVCSNGNPIDLINSLGGTPDATGTWSVSPSTLGGAHLGTYDPVTMSPGSYVYTVPANGVCLTPSSATVLVSELSAPNSGSNGNITVCSNGVAVDLINSLGGTPDVTGTWSASPSTLGGGHLGTYNPNSMSPGTYTYTVAANLICLVPSSSTVTVVETIAPNSGNNGIVTICSNGTPENLFTFLGGTPDVTGTWSASPSTLGGAHLGTYDPVTMSPGSYVYSVAGSGVCLTPSTSTVVVSETTAPNSGINGNVSVCATGTPINLFSSLGGTPDAFGSWSQSPSTLGGGNLGTFDPVNMTVGTYTYTVPAVGACITPSSSTVTVTLQFVVQPPIATTNMFFCGSNSPKIESLVPGANNIVWYATPAGGIALNSTELLHDGHYYATQIVGGCESTPRLDVTVKLSQLTAELVSKKNSICSKNSGEIVVTSSNGVGPVTYLWNTTSTNNTLINIPNGTYSVEVTDSLGCKNTLEVILDCDKTTIPEIISANGNGKNETWVLNLDPVASVQIFNRWGSLVYSAQPYTDDWNGKTNVGATIGNEGLPSGTYFYMIDYKDGNKPVSGYIELIK